MANGNLPRDRITVEAEIRAIAIQLISHLQVISRSVLPIRRSHIRSLVLEINHHLSELARLSDQLPP